MKRRQKAGFLCAISSRITVTKEKERRKRKSEEEERKRREKRSGCTLGFYNGYFGNSFWPKKGCGTEKVHLAVTFSKIRLDIYFLFYYYCHFLWCNTQVPVVRRQWVMFFSLFRYSGVCRPLPSSKNPHFQNEAKCTTFIVKMNFTCMRMKKHFHIKGWALVLIQRPRGTRQWSVRPWWYIGKTGKPWGWNNAWLNAWHFLLDRHRWNQH